MLLVMGVVGEGFGEGSSHLDTTALVTCSRNMESSEGHPPGHVRWGVQSSEEAETSVPVSPQMERRTHWIWAGGHSRFPRLLSLRGKNGSALASQVSRSLGVPLLEMMLFQSYLALKFSDSKIFNSRKA